METIKIKGITFIHGDCMEFLKEQEENAFDLAIVDPPYGMKMKMDGTGGAGRVMRKYKRKETWDIKPNKFYIKRLSISSKNQIIWGANNFWDILPTTTNFIYWYKQQPVDNFADGELAYTSFRGVSKCFNYRYFGKHGQDKNRIHPTQKPVQLYKWLLLNYAKPGQSILDTHGGSGSIAIACHQLGFPLTIIEKDKEYFDNMIKRFKLETAQQSLF